MSKTVDLSPVVKAVSVPATVEQAFSHFVEDFGSWWPGEYTWSGEALGSIVLGRDVGDLCSEFGPHDFRVDWGVVKVFDAPRRLVFSWQISFDRQPIPDPRRAGEVEVSFEPDHEHEMDGFTRVTLEHRGFERYEEQNATYRAAMDGAGGWLYVLASYAGYCDLS